MGKLEDNSDEVRGPKIRIAVKQKSEGGHAIFKKIHWFVIYEFDLYLENKIQEEI